MTLPLAGIPGNIQRNYATINLVDVMAAEDSFMNMLAIHDHSKTDYAKDSMSAVDEEVDNSVSEEASPEDTVSQEQSTTDGGTA